MYIMYIKNVLTFPSVYLSLTQPPQWSALSQSSWLMATKCSLAKPAGMLETAKPQAPPLGSVA
jgi:hypothetical protein